MIESFDLEPAKRRVVTNLYMIILGRTPDPGGLASYTKGAGDSAWISSVASSLLGSDEFRHKQDAQDAAAWLCQNGLGRKPSTEEKQLALVDLTTSLLQRRAEIYPLAAEYPEGIRLTDIVAYNRWLVSERARWAAALPARLTSAEPILSIVLLPRTADWALLSASLQSVRSQFDSRAEVIVALSGRPAPTLPCGLFDGLEGRRVRSIFGSPTFALNKALRKARGTFVCVLDEGNLIEPDTVAQLARVMAMADVILSDEDRIRAADIFERPRLSGGWDPDAATAAPPVGFIAVRRSILRQIGGFRAAVRRQHVWDVLLRASTIVGPEQIVHIPRVLLHRAADCPTSSASQEGRAVVRSFLDSTGRRNCRIDGGEAEPIRVIYPLPPTPPLVSIIVCTRDRAHLLRSCIDGLLDRTHYSSMEVVVVDNDSVEPETKDLLNSIVADMRVRVLHYPGPFNWSAMNNFGAANSRGEVIVLLNNDIDVIDAHWLAELASQAMRPEVGIVGAKLLYPDRSVQHAGMVIGSDCQSLHVWRHADGLAPGYEGALKIVRGASAVTGACIALRRSVFMEVGGLEAQHLAVTWSDTDLCMRVRKAGYKILWTPHCMLYHIELASRGSDALPAAMHRFAREQAYFGSVWAGFADREHFHSPMLNVDGVFPTLRTGP